MKAAVLTRFGGPDVIEIDELLMPEPGYDEVLIQVHGASVNPVDYKIRDGEFPFVPESKLPVVMGRDVCGTVIRRGTEVVSVQEGDALYAFIGLDRGTCAEYAILKPGEYAPKPLQLDAVSAAAVPLAGLTAWQGLFDHGALAPGERVLIHGGAGGVGHLAVQFAKARGAFVITTVSQKDLEFARHLGADQVIDHREQRFEDLVQDIDLVLDLVAGETLDRSWKTLKHSGARLISTLAEPSAALAAEYRARAEHFTAQPDSGQLAEIAGLIDSGKVRVEIERVFPWTQIAAAQKHLQNGHVRGKVVLKVS